MVAITPPGAEPVSSRTCRLEPDTRHPSSDRLEQEPGPLPSTSEEMRCDRPWNDRAVSYRPRSTTRWSGGRTTTCSRRSLIRSVEASGVRSVHRIVPEKARLPETDRKYCE